MSYRELDTSLDTPIERILKTIVKGESGQMLPARVMGFPHLFLYKHYPTWKEDNKTYFVPPLFGGEYMDAERSISESSKFWHLIKNFRKQTGMFIVHGFKLSKISQWNKEVCEIDDYQLAKSPKTGEIDFIIFHHKFGVISVEVCENGSDNTGIQEAMMRLEKNKLLVETLAKVIDYPVDFTMRKVLALPSTLSSNIDQKSFPDTIFLFKENCESILTFENWWKQNLEISTPDVTEPAISQSYEFALSYILMIRHLSLVTELDSMTDFHQTLISSKYHKNQAQPQILESMFPRFWAWCQDVLQKRDRGYNFGNDQSSEAKETFIIQYNLQSEDLTGLEVLKLTDKLLMASSYVAGNSPTKIDEILAIAFENSYYLYFRNIIRFINEMRQIWMEIEVKSINSKDYLNVEEKYPFMKLKTLSDFNTLDRHLANVSFIEGDDQPSLIDKHLFEVLTCQVRLTHAHLPFVMTSDQLAVFEGSLKQLIIGPPGSGKTELMKFKALELEQEIKACKQNKKILYIVANGSPGYRKQESLLFHYMKDFFKKSSLIEVLSIVIDEDFPIDLEHTVTDLTEKIRSKEYWHVFLDEYWIGSKPAEHKIIIELIDGIPGYVWISSVFDFHKEKIHSNDRMIKRTKPLLNALERNNGYVSYITQVLRTTNSIAELERDYSYLYGNRSYPYGTQQIFGNLIKGLPILWSVEKTVDDMYKKSVTFIGNTLRTVLSSDTLISEKLSLDPADIVIVNFAVRIKESATARSLEEYLKESNIRFWKLGENLEDSVNCHSEKVTLFNSLTREDSSYLDGVEWPMVIVILPFELLNNTAELSDGAEKLRNYDSYIAMFRAMVKLVVISDKWKMTTDFLEDVALKSK